MKAKVLVFLLVGVSAMSAQRITGRMNASINGGGGEGKCTIEVVVDNTADVEISGNSAIIRTLSGAPSSFRRFQCNQPMPNRPANFRFEGVDGRGSQTLVSSPQNGGPAVIRIQDQRGGSEGYTFDIFWNGSAYGQGGYPNGQGGYPNDNGGYGRGGSGRRDRDNGGWNNGWGNGSGWNNGDFNFSGRGSGSMRVTKRFLRLENTRVYIAQNGNVNVSFDGEGGHYEFNGVVNSRNDRRVLATVSGAGRSGQMVIEMNARDRVRSINMPNANLTWTN